MPPLRNLKPAPFKYMPRAEGFEDLAPTATPGTDVPDGALQTSAPKNLMPGPIQNFEGISNLCGCAPPDTNGDVGPNHYMEWVNVHFAIYSKTGTLLVGPSPGNTLFPGTPHCAGLNRGDPIVLYDQYAGRWLASQFAFTGSGSTPPFYQCIAISDTSDPTGSWCAYDFTVHNSKFNDYPKFGIWPSQNSYTMTAPLFPTNGGAGSQGVFAFERDRMLACDNTARFVFQDMLSLDPTLPRILPADADGPDLPPSGAPQPIVTDNDDGAGFPQDRIDVWNATMTWGTTPTISVVREGYIPTAPFDTNLGSSCPSPTRQCIPQPGTTNKVDALPNRPMYRLAYRNYGTHEALGLRAHGRRRRAVRKSGGHALVRAQEDDRALGDPEPGDLRTHGRPLPLVWLGSDGRVRRPRHWILDRQWDCPELSEHRLCRGGSSPIPRTSSPRARRCCTLGRAHRPARSAGATTR